MGNSNHTDSKTFCILPWLHMEIQQEGNVYPCCRGQFSTPLGNTHKETPEEIWNSKAYKDLRLKMLAGKKSAYCTDCYRIEECGGLSPRIIHNKRYRNSYDLVDGTAEDGELNSFTLKYLGLRFSNICNLKCHYCSHEYSTSWFSDHIKQGLDSKLLKVTESFNSKKDLLNFVERISLDLESIYIAGGEPLLDKSHMMLLDYLIANKKTDLHLIYNTNLTNITPFGESVIERWEQFKSVTLDASIDSFGDRNDYIRTGSKWENILTNMRTLSEVENISMRIYCTVTTFNIETLIEAVEYWLDEELVKENEILFNLLEMPLHFNIQSLSLAKKKRIELEIKKFSKSIFERSEHPRVIFLNRELQNVINFMKLDDLENEREIFFSKIREMDLIRKTECSAIFPEIFRDE